jgi:hypothetical protein
MARATTSEAAIKHIKSFKNLKEDWDSYGAKTIELRTIRNALDFYSETLRLNPNQPVPFVCPDCNGGVSFHWTVDEQELWIHIEEDKGTFEFLIADRTQEEITRVSGMIYTGIYEFVGEWLKKHKK